MQGGEYVRRHLEELALPVLEGRLRELAAAEIADVTS
jgi:hypothetical protein